MAASTYRPTDATDHGSGVGLFLAQEDDHSFSTQAFDVVPAIPQKVSSPLVTDQPDELPSAVHESIDGPVSDAMVREVLPSLSPVAGEDLAATLTELNELSDNEFKDAFRRYLYDPTPAEQVAFYHPVMVGRSARIARDILDDVNRMLDNPGRLDEQTLSRARSFRNRLGEEHTILKMLRSEYRDLSDYGHRARARARNRLARRFPVEFVEELRIVQAELAAEAAAEKEARRAEARRAKQAEGRAVRAARWEAKAGDKTQSPRGKPRGD